MLTSAISKLKGKKTYTMILAYVLYKLGVNHGVLPVSPDLEIAILGLAGLSLREAVSK